MGKFSYFVAANVMCIACGSACAQAYPSKPIRIIVASAPGGSPDISVRSLATQLTQQVGQPFVVENRPGASGIIGYELLARATPDGYTFGYITFLVATNPFMFSKLPYDLARDFQPLAMSGATPNVLTVNPALQVRSVKELIEHAKSNPGKLSYGSGGVGASPGNVCSDDRNLTGACCVQGHTTGHYRSDRRANPNSLRQHFALAANNQIGPIARTWCNNPEALDRLAGIANARGGWPARL